jgi:CheY-like chemotaxis protein
MVPALLITGDTSPDRLRAALDSGIPVLHKPVAPDDLYQAMSSVLHPR